MKIKELTKLVEYGAVGLLIAVRNKDGWVLIALSNTDNDGDHFKHSLETARGGVRVFKTLDAIAKLSKEVLYSSPFTVC